MAMEPHEIVRPIPTRPVVQTIPIRMPRPNSMESVMRRIMRDDIQMEPQQIAIPTSLPYWEPPPHLNVLFSNIQNECQQIPIPPIVEPIPYVEPPSLSSLIQNVLGRDEFYNALFPQIPIAPLLQPNPIIQSGNQEELPSNTSPPPTTEPDSNPLESYPIQEILFRYADGLSKANLRLVNRAFHQIANRSPLGITKIKVIEHELKIELDVFDGEWIRKDFSKVKDFMSEFL
ncbi:hypothetical protein GCK72_021749 [Caenorhabditis remanei]|uniref:F-box domain-containing protein n=1 Tax=Caenorhabditis remanei TaxID=31234 RepID=A0A6A5GIZ7_CAERE|nr:hypothetical protein GCK72_021749 [Caenorhabditis remanei]KAF1755180.1 hypothetical protein GCK72_021749 [Caenorhabditis remanei]